MTKPSKPSNPKLTLTKISENDFLINNLPASKHDVIDIVSQFIDIDIKLEGFKDALMFSLISTKHRYHKQGKCSQGKCDQCFLFKIASLYKIPKDSTGCFSDIDIEKIIDNEIQLQV